jgi:hypothetical protein
MNSAPLTRQQLREWMLTINKRLVATFQIFRISDSVRVGMVHCFESVALYNRLIVLADEDFTTLDEVFKHYTSESERLITKNWSKTAKLLVQSP